MIGTASEDGLSNQALKRGKDKKFKCSCGEMYFSMENVMGCEEQHPSSFIEEEQIEMDMANAGYSSYSLQ